MSVNSQCNINEEIRKLMANDYINPKCDIYANGGKIIKSFPYNAINNLVINMNL